MPTPLADLIPEQVAARLEWSVRTLYNHIKAGTAPPSYKLGRRRLFPADQFDRWLAKQRRAAK